ncbi:MAG: sigma-70 family RNA polymerase sigma factor [Planctomycetales bacterium]|nr:sigma-70 family RNA polymerase sigma factor [Planctomycetales bacterium]
MSTTLGSKVQEYSLTATQTARDELIVNHLWLVRHLIGKMAARLPLGVDVENLESAGVLGLVEAANRFDTARGVEFKAFAALRIRGAIIDESRRNSPLPQEVMQHVSLVSKAQDGLPSPMSIDDLALTTGLTNDQVLDALAAIPLLQVKPLDETRDDLRHSSLNAPESSMERDDQKRLLADAIASLPERERLIVTMYYREDLRLKEIGQLLNLSESRVSRLLTAAQFQLREYVSSHS